MTAKNNFTFQTFDYILIATASFLLIAAWCYIIISYTHLPETIAIHFDESGQPNGYGLKKTIWIAPILFSLLTIGSLFGAKFPENINFPSKKLTSSEKTANSKTMLFSGVLLSVILFLISLSMVETSLQRNFPTKWIIPTIGILIAIYLFGVFYYQLKQVKS